MEYIVFAAVMLLFLLILMLKGYFDNRKEEKEFIRKLRSDYGVISEKQYKPERFESISHYYEKHKQDFGIDDITWNDLNIDEIYRKMDGTMSAAGKSAPP